MRYELLDTLLRIIIFWEYWSKIVSPDWGNLNFQGCAKLSDRNLLNS